MLFDEDYWYGFDPDALSTCSDIHELFGYEVDLDNPITFRNYLSAMEAAIPSYDYSDEIW